MSRKPIQASMVVHGHEVPLTRVEMTQGLSEATCTEVELTLGRDQASLANDWIRARAELRFAREDEVQRALRLTITRVDVSHRGPEHSVRCVLEAERSLLARTNNTCVIRHQSSVDIARELLSSFAIPLASDGVTPTPKRTVTTQMQESDAALIDRLLEDEGIFTLDDDSGTVLLGDSAASYRPLEPKYRLPFQPPVGVADDSDEIGTLAAASELRPGQVRARQTQMRDRRTIIRGAARGSTGDIAHEQVHPGGNHAGAVDTYVKKTAECFRQKAKTWQGTTTALGLAPGVRFEVHTGPEGGPDGPIVAVRTVLLWHRGDRNVQVQFVAMNADDAFVPPRRTPRPSLPGVTSAFISTPSPTEDVHTDDRGRVKLWFPWDRDHGPSDDASDWVPVLQDYADNSGAVPRRGWEVLVQFEHGDPDRPVVLGRLYNGSDRFPYSPVVSPTRAVLRSLSSPSRKGFNEVMLEDRPGDEEVRIHAQKEHVVEVTRHQRIDVGSDKQSHVGRDESRTISGRSSWNVGGSAQLSIGGNDGTAVSGDWGLRVGMSASKEIGIDRSTRIDLGLQRSVAHTDAVQCDALVETIEGGRRQRSGGSYGTQVGGTMTVRIGGGLTEVASELGEGVQGDRDDDIQGALDLSAKSVEVSTHARHATSVHGAMLSTSADIGLLASEDLKVHASVGAQMSATSSVVLRVGKCQISMSPHAITMYAPERITIRATGENRLSSDKSHQNPAPPPKPELEPEAVPEPEPDEMGRPDGWTEP